MNTPAPAAKQPFSTIEEESEATFGYLYKHLSPADEALIYRSAVRALVFGDNCPHLPIEPIEHPQEVLAVIQERLFRLRPEAKFQIREALG